MDVCVHRGTLQIAKELSEAGSHCPPAKLEGQTFFIPDWAGMRPEKIERKQYKGFRIYELYKYRKSGN